MSVINICLSCDDNYAKYAGVVVASVLANANDEDELKIYILDGGISEDKKEKILSLKTIRNCEIIFVPIDENMFEDYAKVKTHKYISVATYYRLKAPSLLPNIDKIIYFDCDVVVNTSLKPLFDIDISDYLLAGVSDNKKRMVKENPTYVNAGVLVMNLEKMRQNNTEEEFYNYTKKNINTITKGDQEIINEVCKDKIKVIDSQWNVQTSNFVNRSDYTVEPKIIHYLSKEKPWKFGSFSYHKNYWFKYLQLTPWAISEDDKNYWYTKNQVKSIIGYIKYRPLFFIRPRFYKALLLTYFVPLIKNNKILSIQEYNETHNILFLFGIKIKFSKYKYLKLKKENPFYQYKKNNTPINEIPPATGQIRQIQLANLELLKIFDNICKKANLEYWLNYGTLLGAVRHKGYVPWDDDIDVGMMQSDYDKLIEALEKFSPSSDFYLEESFDKVHDKGFLKLKYKKCKHLFVDIFPYKKTEKGITTINTTKEMYDEKIIFPISEIEYENMQFSAVNNANEYLKIIFGDYMQYPKKITMGHSMLLHLSDSEKNVIQNIIKNKI